MAGPPALPVTQQVGRARGCGRRPEQEQEPLLEAARCPVLDADGRSVPFQALYAEQKAIVLFVRVRRGPARLPAGLWEGRVRGLSTGWARAEGEESTKESSAAPETPCSLVK